ncbi:MAG: hypothetical protein FJ109_02535 [Deltaproteobacteria bacterium]|nr:hypothetical protein [Deltaproteobacteria bacterium]
MTARTGLLGALLPFTLVLLTSPVEGYAWNGKEDHCDTPGGFARWGYVDSIEVQLDPGVDNPQHLDPVEWSSHQLSIIRAALATFNHLPTSRIHIHISSTPCDGPSEEPEYGTICFWQVKSDNKNGESWSDYDDASCTIDRGWVRIDSTGAEDDAQLYHHTVHEFSHVFGLKHTNNPYDWMYKYWNATYGGSNIHLGMTRDVRNAYSYLYPVGHNFFFGHFDQRSNAGGDYPYRQWYTDLMVRDAQGTSDTIPWYLTVLGKSAGGGYALFALGEYSDDGDFGNQNTLPYVVGDFTGSGGDDIAAGLCSSPDPGDGAGDTVAWYVMESTTGNSVGFDTTAVWDSDFGNAEDADMYFAANMTGSQDDCDDLVLIRNLSAYDCNATTGECQVRLYVLPSIDTTNPADGECDQFGSEFYLDIDVTDRSATTAWPWVVGDFYTADGLGCSDIAFGKTSQSDPLQMNWYVVKSKDTNANGRCDALELIANAWTSDAGDMGQILWFAGDFGAPNGSSGQDLVRVKVLDSAVQWYVMYSNGSSAFTNGHTPVSDMFIGNDEHFRAKIFAVGNIRGTQSDIVDDFVALVDNEANDDRLRWYCAANNGGSPTPTWTVYSTLTPSTKACWDQATDWDDWNSSKDNGGDDIREDWWCKTCDVWYNETKP